MLLATLSLLQALAAPPVIHGPTHLPDSVRDMHKPVEVPVRLRMSLKVIHTTDMAEGGIGFPPNPIALAQLNNTEDELYYWIAALPKGTGNPSFHVERPAGSPDIWEMGLNSLPKLHRVLFEGEVSAKERAYFAVAIGEQDNADMQALGALFGDIPALIDGMAPPEGQSQVPASFEPAARAVVERIRDEGDDIVGYFVVTVGGGRKLEVEANNNTFVKITSRTATEVKAELDGRGAKYQMRLWVESPSVAVPPARKIVGTTVDRCSENDLWVVGNDGQVLVKKGESKDVRIGEGRFTWYCDGTKESSRADEGTDVVTVRRASTGRKITWRFFREDTLTPDFTD
jgi:hypothetical protein